MLHDTSRHKPISQWSEAERVLIPDSKPVPHGWCGGAREKQQTATGHVVRMRNTRERRGACIGELPAVETSRLYVQ